MKFALKAAVAAVVLSAASPAWADIIMVPASEDQGTLVHNTGTETQAATVTANLGPGGPNIVNFNGDTTGPGDLFRLQNGEGQAEISAALNTTTTPPNDTYSILNANIFLTGNAGMDYIEFALMGTGNPGGGTVDFFITDDGGTVWEFLNVILGNGNTHYAFDAINGQSITNVFFSADTPPGSIVSIRQVRINPAVAGAIPEPGTWAMMLLGFAGAGIAIRRSRRRTGELLQLA